MATYTAAFEAAIDHAMLYEVGGFWNVNHPAVQDGLIDSRENRKAVGYVNDPHDRGGETKYGVARNANPDLNITRLNWEDAKAVYYTRYWLAGKCDRLPGRLAVLHFDGCINHGIGRANKFLQRSVGAYPDGAIGEKTLAQIDKYDEYGICENICNDRENFYRNIAASNPSQARFLTGWLRRISEMREFTTNPDNVFE